MQRRGWKSHVVCVLIIICVIFETRATSARNARSRNHKGSRNIKDDFEESSDEVDVHNGGMDLIGLIEDRLGSDLKDYNHEFMLNRVARSPFDEDIDDVEDSDEDNDDEDEGVTEKGKKNSSSLPHSTIPATTSPIVSSTSKLPTAHRKNPPQGLPGTSPSTSNFTNANTSKPAQAHHKPTLHVNGSAVNLGPGSGRALPPGFKPPGKPPSGFPPHGRPPPGGIFPGGGKLPPHLLKHISKPKPPAKKGELYLPEDYNNLVLPKLNLGKLIGINSYSAVPVLVFLNIRSVRDIDETQETLTLDLDLVIEWVDGFLFDPISAITVRQADITLNPIFLKKIWRPDIYIDEIVKVKRTSLMNKPLKLKFNPSNGFISYTTRLTVQLSCDMLYFYYPADTHRCEFTFRSYSYFGKDMELSWLGTGVYLQDPYDPNFDLQVESIDRVKLPQTFRRLTNDTYDGLRFTILARRKLSFHMVQTYLPSIFFIVITWLCFLVPARMVEARIGISMTTLLTLTSMFASVRESTPIVSYVKAIDIWMVFCIFFVFLTLLEFAIFVWLRARREDAEENKLDHQRKMQVRKEIGNKDLEASFTRSPSLESIELRKYERFAEFTEKYAFIIFSVVFIIFNVIYWSWLLVASNYFDWNVNTTLNADLD